MMFRSPSWLIWRFFLAGFALTGGSDPDSPRNFAHLAFCAKAIRSLAAPLTFLPLRGVASGVAASRGLTRANSSITYTDIAGSGAGLLWAASNRMPAENTPAKRISIPRLLPAHGTPLIRIATTFLSSQRTPAVPDEKCGESGQK
jgi:hypothetical protein